MYLSHCVYRWGENIWLFLGEFRECRRQWMSIVAVNSTKALPHVASEGEKSNHINSRFENSQLQCLCRGKKISGYSVNAHLIMSLAIVENIWKWNRNRCTVLTVHASKLIACEEKLKIYLLVAESSWPGIGTVFYGFRNNNYFISFRYPITITDYYYYSQWSELAILRRWFFFHILHSSQSSDTWNIRSNRYSGIYV